MAFLGLCRATGIGSLPHADPAAAVEAALAAAPDLPYWPQLPQRSKREGMVEQALAGLPGLRIIEGRLRHVQDEAFFLGAERILAAYEAGDADAAAMADETAAGLKPFLYALAARRIRQAKGQIAGPITTGMAVLGEDGNPILYDDALREVLAKFLSLRVRWQAAQIRAAGTEPVIFVDEPFLASFGTAFFGWGKDEVQATLRAVVEGAGPTGSHCCSNTDWAMLLESPLDVVSFDAFEFAENFLVYREAIGRFLSRGGTIAWGIVPTDPDAVASATAEALGERLLGLVARVEALGFPREQVLRQALVTPACGLGTRPMETAARALRLARDVAAALRQRFLAA